MGLKAPIVFQGALAPWLDVDKPLGTAGSVQSSFVNAFISTTYVVASDIVVEIRDSGANVLKELTITAGNLSVESAVSPAESLAADEDLFARITSAPSTAFGLVGWYEIDDLSWLQGDLEEPITLGEATDRLKVDTSDDDPLIMVLITAARQAAEAEMRRAIVGRTETYYLDDWPGGEPDWFDGWREGPVTVGQAKRVGLPYGPIRSVSSVKTFDDADAETVFSSANYYVDLEKAQVILRNGKIWPAATRTAQAIEIIYVTGYASPATVPREIKQGILNHLGVMYENRDREAPMPDSSRRLYGPYYIAKDMV
jgi:hypothetical protein